MLVVHGSRSADRGFMFAVRGLVYRFRRFDKYSTATTSRPAFVCHRNVLAAGFARHLAQARWPALIVDRQRFMDYTLVALIGVLVLAMAVSTRCHSRTWSGVPDISTSL